MARLSHRDTDPLGCHGETSETASEGRSVASSPIRVTLPYPPSVNRAWRMANGRMIQSPAAKAWKRQSAWIARAAGLTPTSGPVPVTVKLHPKMTKAGTASRRRIDCDNALKCALDALQGVAYLDDHQVTEVHASVGQPIHEGGLTVYVSSATNSQDYNA